MKLSCSLVWIGVLAFVIASPWQQSCGQITIPGQDGTRRTRNPARHGVPRMSCVEIGQAIADAMRGQEGMGMVEFPVPGELDCSAAVHVPQGASLEVAKVFWSTVLRSWEFSLRCAHSADCIPFLIRTRSANAVFDQNATGVRASLSLEAAPSHLPGNTSSRSEGSRFAFAPSAAVNPGQGATLVWEQGGIRAEFAVICLDRGGIGESVRARVKNGDRILRAEVVSEGRLRATP